MENLLFDLHFFRSGLDHYLHIAQLDRRSGGNDPGAAFLRFLPGHDPPLHGVGVYFFNIGQATIHLFPANIPKDDAHSARTQPLRNAGAHDSGSDYGSVRDFCCRRLRGAPLVLLGQEEIADQIPRRLGFAKLDDGIQLQGKRLIDWERSVDYLKGYGWGVV